MRGTESIIWGVLGILWWVEPLVSFSGGGEGVNVIPERVEGVRGDVGLLALTDVWIGLCTAVTLRMLAEVVAGGMMRGRRTGRWGLDIVVGELS